MINSLDAILHQRLYLFRRNRAPAAAEHFDMRCAELTQAIDHVTEELVMPALVRADSYAVGIFVNRRTDDVIDTPVVTEVHDLCALRLNEAPHDIDRSIVAVE